MNESSKLIVKLQEELTQKRLRVIELEQAIMSNCYDDPSTSSKRLMALVTEHKQNE